MPCLASAQCLGGSKIDPSSGTRPLPGSGSYRTSLAVQRARRQTGRSQEGRRSAPASLTRYLRVRCGVFGVGAGGPASWRSQKPARLGARRGPGCARRPSRSPPGPRPLAAAANAGTPSSHAPRTRQSRGWGGAQCLNPFVAASRPARGTPLFHPPQGATSLPRAPCSFPVNPQDPWAQPPVSSSTNPVGPRPP